MILGVTVVEERGKVLLVEWRDLAGPHRVLLPREVVQSETAEWEELEQGAPYGVPWELLPIGNVGPEPIALALRERGLWTSQQARQNLSQVRAALQQAYSRDLKTILEATRT